MLTKVRAQKFQELNLEMSKYVYVLKGIQVEFPLISTGHKKSLENESSVDILRERIALFLLSTNTLWGA